MSSIYYASTAVLILFSIYRPFITKLDLIKYVLLGFISFLTPFIITYNNKLIMMTTATILDNTEKTFTNITSTIMYSTINNASTTKNAAALLNYNNDNKCLYINAILYLLISAFTVSVTGLFTRWHFPILFIKPNSNIYINGLTRHGVSTLFVILAILRYFFLHMGIYLTFNAKL